MKEARGQFTAGKPKHKLYKEISSIQYLNFNFLLVPRR